MSTCTTLSGNINGRMKLSGYLSKVETLTGRIVPEGVLSGRITVPEVIIEGADAGLYGGEYEVTPSSSKTVLDTANKLLKKDVVVKEIPFYKTSNMANGETVYIGKDVT